MASLGALNLCGDPRGCASIGGIRMFCDMLACLVINVSLVVVNFCRLIFRLIFQPAVQIFNLKLNINPEKMKKTSQKLITFNLLFSKGC